MFSALSHFLSLSIALSLSQDVLEGGNLRSPLQELHYIIGTPIKAFNSTAESPQRPLLSAEGKSAATGVCVSGGEAESSTTLIAEGDIPAQFTRVMGKGTHKQTCLSYYPCEDFPLTKLSTQLIHDVLHFTLSLTIN